MGFYRKKPVVIEAEQFTGDNIDAVLDFVGDMATCPEGKSMAKDQGLIIRTLEGDHHASVGDWIIKGVAGEFYPCKPDIFEATYELAKLTQG